VETDRKQQIIKAAIKRFARHGLSKTTLDEIARDLRIGKATIYHYFDSKETLYFGTLEYDSGLIIEEIKNIFDNQELSLNEKFTEYLVFKENVYEKYKLIYDLVILLLNQEGLEQELVILKKLLQAEEEVLKVALNAAYTNKSQQMNADLPNFFVYASWGMLYSKKLNDIINPEKQLSTKEFFMRSMEHFLK